MWINNTDKEVEYFHPICQKALEQALELLNLSLTYEVQHHRRVGNIEMDLVVANRQSNKILCVIEVKRTVAAVKSMRYQYQAMSYVQALGNLELESPYYILTNLEVSCLFKYDKNRPNVYEQVISPGIQKNHYFAECTKNVFWDDLSKQYAHYLQVIIKNSGEYLLSFTKFAKEIESDLAIYPDKWAQDIAVLFYEYIRGSFARIKRTDLKSISQLAGKLNLVCQEGLKVNFKDIFSIPDISKENRNILIEKSLLEQLFKLGNTYGDADELANVMHKVISNGHEHEGEVATDPDLALAMMEIANCLGGGITDFQKIMDPAAGSGTLLSVASETFVGLQPKQLVANDINDKLIQLLSLRLGLKFASQINKQNTISLSALNVADMDETLFHGVKYIVMNPPYLSATGSNCIAKKTILHNRIRQLKKEEPKTLVGQMPLEGVFLELISCLAEEGTIMAAILPSSHLTTRGVASVALREMLLDDFGLQVVFSYPQENLFSNVAQNTSIVIGIKGSKPTSIKYINSTASINNVDISIFKEIFRQEFPKDAVCLIKDDIEGCEVSCDYLKQDNQHGWRILSTSILREATDFFQSLLALSTDKLIILEDSIYQSISRGTVGNKGGSDLLFHKSNSPLLSFIRKKYKKYLSIGLVNAKLEKQEITEGDSFFFNVDNLERTDIIKVINQYIKQKKANSKKQRQDIKSKENYLAILLKDSRAQSPANSVLLPRAIRGLGRIYRSAVPVFVSTNFLIIPSTEEGSRILTSWMSTVFFQLECEILGNNRRGLRKMEKQDYAKVHVPNFNALSELDKRNLLDVENEGFLDLRMPKTRKVDEVWAQLLFGKDAEYILETACSLLACLVANREY